MSSNSRRLTVTLLCETTHSADRTRAKVYLRIVGGSPIFFAAPRIVGALSNCIAVESTRSVCKETLHYKIRMTGLATTTGLIVSGDVIVSLLPPLDM